ncbi:MAG: TrfA family protein [Neisseriaceae bacterium]|nr:TrfA family protein [Neisseriaceae bacterium]
MNLTSVATILNDKPQLPQHIIDEVEAKAEKFYQYAKEHGVTVDKENYRNKLLDSERFHQQQKAKKAKTSHDIMKELSKSFEATPDNFLRKNKIDIEKPIALSEIAPHRTDVRVLPNDFARSSLFFVKKKGTPRKSMNREKIFHLSEKVEVRYTGEELRADDDELVWLSLVHYCYDQPLGDAVDVKVSDLLKDLDWKPTGESYQRIRTIISRLKATDVIIKNKATYGDLEDFKKKRKKSAPSLSRGISMIDGYLEYDKVDGLPTRYLISIDKMLIFFFCGGLFTYLDWKQYKKLTPTGRRLTDYVLSHKEPEPLSVERFLLTCGSEETEPKRQNQQARRACEELIKKGIVYDARVEDGFIVIEREQPKILEHQP